MANAYHSLYIISLTLVRFGGHNAHKLLRNFEGGQVNRSLGDFGLQQNLALVKIEKFYFVHS